MPRRGGLVILLAAGGYIAWQKYSEHREAQRAAAFFAAIGLTADPDPAKAKAAVQATAQGSDGIADLARFRAAALQITKPRTKPAPSPAMMR